MRAVVGRPRGSVVRGVVDEPVRKGETMRSPELFTMVVVDMLRARGVVRQRARCAACFS